MCGFVCGKGHIHVPVWYLICMTHIVQIFGIVTLSFCTVTLPQPPVAKCRSDGHSVELCMG